MEHLADLGVIGGSGLYSLLEGAREHEVDTPYGPPSAPLSIGTVDGRSVAFLPRHGAGHQYPPHRINYRANIWALRAAGVRQILSPCAVGSLRPERGPGTVTVPDQLIDRTTGRDRTFFDSGAAHVSFADPYCPVGRAAVLKSAADSGLAAIDGGTLVVIDGQRFSTRAESWWYAAQGWSLVNMTALPEAALARELALCYTTVALVTDLDAGIDATGSVTQEEVFRVFAENTARVRALLLAVVPTLPAVRDCPCAAALDGLDVPIDLP